MSDDRTKWRRIGVIVPSSNTTVEADFMRALPAGVTVHAARMFLAETTAEAERRMIYDHVPIAPTSQRCGRMSSPLPAPVAAPFLVLTAKPL